ncbi:MAG: response regulator [Chloroflexi bacterium]|nr:response regulator [Chloroflexota bacterium]
MEPGAVIMVVSGPELWGIERIRLALFEAGYKVAAVDFREQQLSEAVFHHKPAMVIANLSGSQPEDLELCQRLTRMSDAPVVAIGSSADEAFRVNLLSAGADDYLVRPINPRELVARVRNILRRTQPTQSSIPIDEASKGATLQESIPPKPFFLLSFFRNLVQQIHKSK